MTQSLTEFIASVRLADSIEHEKFLINSEQADIRTYIRKCEPEMRPRIVAKLIFLSTLGQNVTYGQMEVITLMSHEQFSYKRIGYIAASLLLDEESEVTVLITHTVLKDLQSTDPQTQCLALSLISNIGSAETCRTVSSDVIKLIESENSQVLKRAAMAGVRIVERVPDLAENFKPVVQKLLKHGAHGVVASAIHLMFRIIKTEPTVTQSWTKYAPAFTKILKQLSSSKPGHEFAFTVFNDPFLQLRVLKILADLKKPSDELDEVLESIVTGVDIKRNTGRSLLFQAVETICATAQKPTLRGLAFSQVGRLFRFKEANVLYSALSIYSRVLYSGREIIDRTSGDSIALQRYKSQVVQCLNHRDPSIRRRALDVVSALVDEKNVETLIPEVLDYVKLADSEFRVELIAKIFTAVQRFAHDPKWNFDTVHRILIDSGNYLGNDIITSICRLILHTPSIQAHAVKQLGGSMLNFSDNQSLIQVSSWVLGEFLNSDDGSVEALKRIILMPQTTDITKGYIITALSKIAVRINKKKEVSEFLGTLSKSNSLDVQQRAGEMSQLLLSEDLCDDVLAPVEIEEEKKDETAQPTNDLLDLGGAHPAEPNKDAPKLAPVAETKDAAKTEKTAMQIPPGAIEALRKPEYIMYFEIRKNPQNAKQIAVRASMFNLGKTALSNFSVKYGVPVGWLIQAQAPTGTMLEPAGGKPILQQFFLQGQADAPLAMKAQISYMYGSQPITEVGEINPIFG